MNFKKYKIPLLIFLISSIFFYIMYYWIIHYADHGADGLGGFLLAMILGILFIISLIGFVIFLVLSVLSKQAKWIQFFVATILPAIAIYLIFAMLGGFEMFGIG